MAYGSANAEAEELAASDLKYKQAAEFKAAVDLKAAEEAESKAKARAASEAGKCLKPIKPSSNTVFLTYLHSTYVSFISRGGQGEGPK
jgi:hypothetical protein